MKKNKLILIGFNSDFIAYLNIDIEEALKRYEESEKTVPNRDSIQTIEFDDSFGVYNAWSVED